MKNILFVVVTLIFSFQIECMEQPSQEKLERAAMENRNSDALYALIRTESMNDTLEERKKILQFFMGYPDIQKRSDSVGLFDFDVVDYEEEDRDQLEPMGYPDLYVELLESPIFDQTRAYRGKINNKDVIIGKIKRQKAELRKLDLEQDNQKLLGASTWQKKIFFNSLLLCLLGLLYFGHQNVHKVFA